MESLPLGDRPTPSPGWDGPPSTCRHPRVTPPCTPLPLQSRCTCPYAIQPHWEHMECHPHPSLLPLREGASGEPRGGSSGYMLLLCSDLATAKQAGQFCEAPGRSTGLQPLDPDRGPGGGDLQVVPPTDTLAMGSSMIGAPRAGAELACDVLNIAHSDQGDGSQVRALTGSTNLRQ